MHKRIPFGPALTLRAIEHEPISTISVTLCGLSLESQRWHHVDVWEDNIVASAQGVVAFHQVILWRLEEHNGVTDYYVVAWQHQDKCIGPERING